MIMENLDLLLEADKTIKERIGGALKSLAKWFKDKMDWAKAQVTKLKNKFKKPPVEPEKKDALSKAKAGINGVISNCKKGLSAVKAENAEEAASCKDEVLTHMDVVKASLGVLAGSLVVTAAKNGAPVGVVVGGVVGYKNAGSVGKVARAARRKFRGEDTELDYDGYDEYYAEDSYDDYDEYYAEDSYDDYDDYDEYYAEDYYDYDDDFDYEY